MNEETRPVFAHGEEEQKYAWDLAGQRYSPLRYRGKSVRTTWDVREAVGAAENRGVKVTELLTFRDGDGDTYCIIADLHYGSHEALALINGNISVSLYARHDAALDFFTEALLDGAPGVPMPKPVPSNAITVSFSYGTTNGNQSVSRNIAAPAWGEIKENYPEQVRGDLDSFVKAGPEGLRGHLGILHGAPGTGKSTFIRSLAKEWKDKARITYIVDTEVFFTSPGYLLDVILSPGRIDTRPKWHLIVCEDAEDFLTREAKARVGQAISRILNVGDGMLGQGLRVLILFTTNAKRAELDEAITRKGRCFLNATLPEFDREEAITWLGGHGIGREDAYGHLRKDTGLLYNSISLADLYDITGEPAVTELEGDASDALEDWEAELLEGGF